MAEFFAPLPLAAVGLLAVNDHVLKRVCPGWITGKLSDVALCFFLPLLVSAVLGVFSRADARVRLWIGCVLTALVFSALELSAAAVAWYCTVMPWIGDAVGTGPGCLVTRDLSDLACLGMLPLAYRYGLGRRGNLRSQRAELRLVTMFATSWLLIATSVERPPHCAHESVSVAFRSSGTCGPDGIIVVHADSDFGEIWVDNSHVIGVAPLDRYPNVYSGSHGEYRGEECPYQLKDGNWVLFGRSENTVQPDAGVPTDANPSVIDGGVSPDHDYRGPAKDRDICVATLVSGKLELICSNFGQPTCRTTLTPLD